jgi:anaphase-promoting complex subunit 1
VDVTFYCSGCYGLYLRINMLHQILKLRFSKDHRVAEVRRLLQSSHPVQISIMQRPEVSDHEFIEEQEKHLYAICTRTMALPVGR